MGSPSNALLERPTLHRPLRVLVAESNAHLATVLAWVLSDDERFQVVGTARDGEAALACGAEFDLALVDLRIFGLGALGTIAHLHERRPRPTIVVLADTDAVYLRHATAAEGADGYLVKAAELDNLGDRLVSLVEARATLPAPGGR
jgi:DNA-binding NarL/FixJ family response regulator